MKKSKKIIVIILAVIVLLILFFPLRYIFKDGGSIMYDSLTYRIIDYRCAPDENGEALRGKTVEILGFEVYDGTYKIKK